MLAAFMLLWSLRKGGRPIGWIFGLYLVIAGVERFLIEILRAKDDRFLGPFTLAQLTSVVLIAVGIWVLTKLRQGRDPAPGPYSADWQEGRIAKSLTVALSALPLIDLHDCSPDAVNILVGTGQFLEPGSAGSKITCRQRLTTIAPGWHRACLYKGREAERLLPDKW